MAQHICAIERRYKYAPRAQHICAIGRRHLQLWYMRSVCIGARHTSSMSDSSRSLSATQSRSANVAPIGRSRNDLNFELQSIYQNSKVRGGAGGKAIYYKYFLSCRCRRTPCRAGPDSDSDSGSGGALQRNVCLLCQCSTPSVSRLPSQSCM